MMRNEHVAGVAAGHDAWMDPNLAAVSLRTDDEKCFDFNEFELDKVIERRSLI